MVKIAICDDNLTMCNTIEDFVYMIKQYNTECDVYQDGQELIYAYEKNNERYDIIFLDIEMNELDGIKAASLMTILIKFANQCQRYLICSIAIYFTELIILILSISNM